ncbi:MAG TPA: alpha-L-rhamnosidase N-terminal domain-containing protein, partial [Trueperaceae bacterium]|nr:alpha-L-rhamnosidase N-terminal domain-containing protein [Trueperaceae bacterium]
MNTSSIQPVNLRCEYLRGPLGIDTARPRLSWQLSGERRGAMQSAYQVMVTTTEPGNDVVWDSGRVASDASVHVEYGGPALRSRQRYHWTVTVWDENDHAATSTEAWWEMGLLAADEWRADWIGLGNAGPFGSPLPAGGTRPRQAGTAAADTANASVLAFGERRPSPYLRTTFEVAGPVRRARIYATARGVYELRLNGERVGDALLPPGWTDYHQRIQYQTYDVSKQLRDGVNTIGAILGDGWYCGYLGFDPRWRAYRYGYKPSLLLRLEVDMEDG